MLSSKRKPTSCSEYPAFNSAILTCLGVDGKEALRVAAGDAVGQLVAGSCVRVKGLDLDDGHVLG